MTSNDDKDGAVKALPELVDEEKLKAALRKKCRSEQPFGHKCHEPCDDCYSMKDMLFGARALQGELGIVAVVDGPCLSAVDLHLCPRVRAGKCPGEGPCLLDEGPVLVRAKENEGG